MEKSRRSIYRFIFCLFCIFSGAVFQKVYSSAASKEDFAEIKSHIIRDVTVAEVSIVHHTIIKRCLIKRFVDMKEN